jgi:nicotinamide-nucleotide amidase
MKTLRADILAIGSELLHGGKVDSNSIFIADILAQCGIRVAKKMSLSDERGDIRSALLASLRKADVVIVTGGLGSTVDDCTREAVATTLKRPLVVRRKAMQILKRQVEERGRVVTPLLAKQALMPSGAIVLDNFVGTAPGFYVQEEKTHVFVLPGVPREARAMMDLQVRTILKKKLKATAILWSQAFNTVGLPETEIQQRLLPLLPPSSAATLSLLASTKGVKVTLSCWRPKNQKSRTSNKAKDFPEGAVLSQVVRETLKPWLFSEGDTTMEEVVGQLLISHHWTLGLAESCTGGLIAHRLTEVPGSSTYLDRGVVTYSNRAKQELLGVAPGLLRKYGAVSAEVAQAMAKGIRVKSRVDLGVSVTGIAGPGGGSSKKPVGLVYMAIDGHRGSQWQRCQFWGDRSEIKFRSSQAALNMIRLYLLHANG